MYSTHKMESGFAPPRTCFAHRLILHYFEFHSFAWKATGEKLSSQQPCNAISYHRNNCKASVQIEMLPCFIHNLRTNDFKVKCLRKSAQQAILMNYSNKLNVIRCLVWVIIFSSGPLFTFGWSVDTFQKASVTLQIKCFHPIPSTVETIHATIDNATAYCCEKWIAFRRN